jgi:2-iminobutanoate/2-iminopropanoate deaminase
MTKSVVSTDRAPRAIGPYSQAIVSGDLLFVSGQIPLVPETSELRQGSIEEQTRQVLDNLSAILAAAGGSLDDIVKTTIYLADLGDFTAVNGVYGTYFQERPPARATVQVAALPLGAAIEIDAIARLGPG